MSRPETVTPVHILLVDAEPAYLLKCRSRLEQDGYEVLMATDSQAAIEFAMQLAPDLIVLAMVLPPTGGLAVLEALRAEERTRAVPVVVLSSNTERRLVERSRELGAVDYLSKNLTTPAVLSAWISDWLGARRAVLA